MCIFKHAISSYQKMEVSYLILLVRKDGCAYFGFVAQAKKANLFALASEFSAT
jgi:hypothetical protein